jgi:hypothetical protein
MAVFLTAKCHDISRQLMTFHDSAAVYVRPLLFWYVSGLGWQPLTDVLEDIGPETPATIYQTTTRNIPEERRPQGS